MAHAILSPSSAERWLACPPSAQLNYKLDDEQSRYAAEGTLAHTLGDLQLQLALKQITKRKFNAELKKIKEDELFYQGMIDEVQEYTDLVMTAYQEAKENDPAAEIYIEQKLDLDTYAPESFGTGDAVILTKDYVHVIDLKFGKGVAVEADDNPQLKLYGLGALEEYGFLHDIKEVRATIAQIRRNSILTYTAPAEEVKAWGEEHVRPIAELAFEGEGEFKAGDHCRFCKHGSKCKARAQFYEAEFEKAEAATLSNEEIARLLGLVSDMVNWAESLKNSALEAALEGESFPGWKLVEGRSIRKITDQERLAEALIEEGYSSTEFYKPRQLKGLGDLEKLVGKKKFFEISTPYIEKPAGKPTLAPENDKRPALDISLSGLEFDQ